MPNPTYQLPRDSTMQGIVTQLQNIASRMNNSGGSGSGSGGGSTVIANPSDTASDDLTSIEIDGTVYDIPTGSSYDDTQIRALIAAKQDALTAGTGINIANGTISCTVQGGSGSSGAGGISNLSVVTEHYTGGDNTTTRTFTLPDNRTPFMVNIKGLTIIEGSTYWHGELNFKWGDSFAFGSCTSTNTNNQLLGGNDYVTYSGNTFTIQGYNIGYAFNTTTSDFDVTYIYLDENSSGSSGGSGYTVTNLFTGSASEVGDYELSDSILNYDDLEFIFKINSQSDDSAVPYRISAQEFYDRFKYGTAQSDDNFMVNMWDTGAFRITLGQNDDPEFIHVLNNYAGTITGGTALVCVNGIKYGSGSGEGSSDTPRQVDLLYSNDTREIADTVTLAHPYTDYDYLVLGISDISQYAYRLQTVTILKEQLDDLKADSTHYLSYYQAADAFLEYVVTNNTTLTKNRAAYECIVHIYGVKEGSGSGSSNGTGRTQTKIWDYVTDNNNAPLYGLTTATLHQSIDDFDELIMEVVSILSDETDATWKGTTQFIVDVNALKNSFEANYISLESLANRSSKYYISGTTLQKTAQATENTNGLVSVYGVKYGSGGNAVSASYEDEVELFANSTTVQATNITLSDDYDKYEYLRFYICRKISDEDVVLYTNDIPVDSIVNPNGTARIQIQGYDNEYITYFLSSNSPKREFTYQSGNGYLYVKKVVGVKQRSTSIAPKDVYSTSEKIIGEWIDGRPIYQITLGNDTTPFSSYDATALNIDYVIDIDGIYSDSSTGLANGTYSTKASSTSVISSAYLTYSKSTHTVTAVPFTGGYIYCPTLQYVKTQGGS